MNITVTGRQMTVSDSLKEKVGKKLAKYDRFFPKGADVHVTFKKVRDKECLEITINQNGILFRGEEVSDTFENALDSSIEAIDRQIRKNKTRLEKRNKEGLIDFSAFDDNSEDEEAEFNIRVKQFYFKPMTPEEAIMQMNLLGHSFFVFNNAETEETCVVYKKKDNNYGMIVPSVS